MEYKKKVKLLLIIIGGLSVIFITSLIFTPQFFGGRSASYIWLERRYVPNITEIIISETMGSIELIKRDNQWFVTRDDREYPARHLRVEDFINVFTRRAQWPVRSSNAASHARLGLSADTETRVTFFRENGVLLDVLFGNVDLTGREIFIRRTGQNEVRSGDSIVNNYIRSSVNTWFNLRLIPETEDGRITVDNIQRLSVFTPGEAQVFNRRNRQWVILGFEDEDLQQSAIDSYVRNLINIEGSDFIDHIAIDDPIFDYGRIVLEIGDGRIKTLRISGGDEDGGRLVHIDGTNFIYSIAPWIAGRLFTDLSGFLRQ